MLIQMLFILSVIGHGHQNFQNFRKEMAGNIVVMIVLMAVLMSFLFTLHKYIILFVIKEKSIIKRLSKNRPHSNSLF